MEFQDFLALEKIYNPSEIDNVLRLSMKDIKTIKTNKKIVYYNVPCSFDIETSSFFRLNGKGEQEKISIMYEWTFGINGLVIIGRTWNEFFNMLEKIIEYLGINIYNRLVCYVHNLSYEFQFIRNWLEWEKVFSIDTRKPIYAVTKSGIEFRCSYLLSGYSLEKLGEQLQKYKLKKLVNWLNYELIRHSKTPLTDNEYMYCILDVKVVMCYIQEKIEQDGNITKIPMTKTGYVRQYCRNMCFYEKGVSHKKSFKRLRYRELMQSMTLSPDEYRQLKRAFQGGFTHANPFYSGKTLENVSSDDFTSSYPFCMIAEKFPMSSSKLIELKSKEEFEESLSSYCCVFDVEISDLQSKVFYDSYISVSRCWSVSKPVINNGRIVSADHLCITLTEQDYFIIKIFYAWSDMKISNFRRYKKSYLPTDFVRAILALYSDKTTLKGVDGKEIEYLKGKEMLNSCYGMAVTDICRDLITYTNEWGMSSANIDESIEQYNNNPSRFLFYPWGVWVTAYARRNLFTGIINFNNDYVYSDTDSIKTINRDKHIKYIEEYNKRARNQLIEAMKYHKLSLDMIEPKTIKGEKKCLGVWDYEGTYNKFKTLGAKRYMVQKDGKVNITVSGLNKKIAVPYMVEKWGDKVFDHFNNDLYIPPEYTGKNTHTYIDEEKQGVVTDYLGVSCEYYEKSSVHLMKSDYSLSLSKEYVDYIMGIQDDSV